MKKNDPWKRLAGAARRSESARPPSAAEMPFGFDTRVLARLRAPGADTRELWARLAWRAVPMGVAALLVCWVVLPTPPAADSSATDEIEQLMQEVLNP